MTVCRSPMPVTMPVTRSHLSHIARMPLIVLGDVTLAEPGVSIIDLETDDDRAELARSLFCGKYSEDAA